MSVCVVDDSPVSLAHLRILLQQAGVLDMRTFTQPEEALSWCMQHPPRLLLLDYNMPSVDGLEFLSRLRSTPGGREVPVAFVSSWAVHSFRMQALSAGAIDVIEKPYSADEFKLKVRSLLSLPGRSVAADAKADPRPAYAEFDEVGSSLEFPDAAVIRMLERLATIRADRTVRSTTLVAQIAATIAGAYGMSMSDQELILRATPLHDFGLWSVDRRILASPVLMSPEDRKRLDAAPLVGHSLFKDYTSPVLRMAAEIARSHREHWDGSGQPHGLVGEAIPLAGRIVAVADMFERMYTAYLEAGRKQAFERATRVIRADSGGHFDPEVVEVFWGARASLQAIVRFSR